MTVENVCGNDVENSKETHMSLNARRAVLAALATALLTACAPGYSVNTVSATPSGVSYEYTHSVSSEYPATVKRAEAHCAQYGKHARPVGAPVRLDIDRAVATFECVASH